MKESHRQDLDVPYEERGQVKARGAFWDPRAKTWFLPAGKAQEPFLAWIPRAMWGPKDFTTLIPPIYQVESRMICWKCRQSVRVVTVASAQLIDHSLDEDGPFNPPRSIYTFSYVFWLPMPLLTELRRVNPWYRKARSEMADKTYYMNHCPCGACFGDFFLHCEPDGAFFPLDSEGEAERIKLRHITEFGRQDLAGSWTERGYARSMSS